MSLSTFSTGLYTELSPPKKYDRELINTRYFKHNTLTYPQAVENFSIIKKSMQKSGKNCWKSSGNAVKNAVYLWKTI